jgi:hypothetical protein
MLSNAVTAAAFIGSLKEICWEEWQGLVRISHFSRALTIPKLANRPTIAVASKSGVQ